MIPLKKLKNLQKSLQRLLIFLEKIELKNKKSIIEILNSRHISFQEFKDLLLRLNGIIRDVPKGERRISDRVEIITWSIFNNLTGYVPPQNKDQYLKKMYDIFHSSETPENKARILYYAMQFIHPFSDGNGRTGRFLYELISNNYDLKHENLEKVLQNTSWRQLLSIPDAEKVSHLIEWLMFRDSDIFEEAPKGLYSGIMLDTYDINKNISENWLYKQAQKIMDSNYLSEDMNFRSFILYKINKNKKYTKFSKHERTGKIFFDWEEIMDNLQEDDLKFIIDEYKKYEEKRMNMVFDIEKINLIVDHLQNKKKK